MNRKQMLISFLCGLVLPLVVLGLKSAGETQQERAPVETTTATEETRAGKETLWVLSKEGGVEQMELEDYLTGVVLSEMPADFHEEALRAQAVVARTYVMKRMETGKHDDAAVCMESSCCQGYRSPAEYMDAGGREASVEKVRQAVADTTGQVLLYEGELIDATYFSCSGGSTEAAVAVWGTDVPYLQAVDSPGEEEAAYDTDQVSFTREEFSEALGGVSGNPESWFGAVSYTQGGGVETMEIGGVEYRGTELRRLLGLRSTAFEIEIDGDEIIVSTHGFGHRVGMSQYGAQAMAEAGSGYEEILAHYYQGTQLMRMQGMDEL